MIGNSRTSQHFVESETKEKEKADVGFWSLAREYYSQAITRKTLKSQRAGSCHVDVRN